MAEPAVAKSWRWTVALAILLALGAGLLSGSWRLTLTPSEASGVVVATQLIDMLLSACAAVAIWVGSSRLTAEKRLSWRLVSVGVGLWSVGTSLTITAELNGGLSSSQVPETVCRLAMVPLIAVGILIYPTASRRHRAMRSLVDGLLVGFSILLILWSFGLRAAIENGDQAQIQGVSNATFALSTTLLVVMAVLLTYSARDSAATSHALLAAGLGVIAVTQIAQFIADSLDYSDSQSLVFEAGWSVGFILMAAAGLFLDPTVSPPLRGRHPNESSSIVIVPTLLGAISLFVAIVDVSTQGGSVSYTLPLLLVVAGLMLVRQSLMLGQRRKLTDRLSDSVDALSLEASHDRLTGLPNRTNLLARLKAQQIEATGRVGVLFIDIDYLKAVNDSLGHGAGDALIRDTAQHLATKLDATHLTRFGGDEFVALIEAESVEDLLTSAEELISQTSPDQSLSAGLAVWRDGEDAQEILRRADIALFAAKAMGRNRVVEYAPSLDEATRRRVKLEPQLQQAVKRGELQVHYQPVISLHDGHLIGAEALVRWDHPERGLLTPHEFLRDADASGLMIGIGQFVLQTAVEDFAGLNRATDEAHLNIAVNMSTTELLSSGAARFVQDVLTRTGLDPSDLTIEITEDVVLDDATRATIDQLTEIGVSIAIDDFGTGNSSLRQLGGYPARYLKVDRTFVQGLGRDHQDSVVVAAIIRLAQSMGLSTVAEGVESKEQADELRQLGCDAAQGWHYDKAKPFADLRSGHLRAQSRLRNLDDSDNGGHWDRDRDTDRRKDRDGGGVVNLTDEP